VRCDDQEAFWPRRCGEKASLGKLLAGERRGDVSVVDICRRRLISGDTEVFGGRTIVKL
jgi:hypothetical protein